VLLFILGFGVMKRSMVALIVAVVIFTAQLGLQTLAIVAVLALNLSPGPLLYGVAGINLLLLIGVARHIPTLSRLNAAK
jgi:hypothetical protein